jgi:Carboxypeptidase regulatory-like domain
MRPRIFRIAVAFGFSSLPALACVCAGIGGNPCQTPTGDMIALATVVSKELVQNRPLPQPEFSNRQASRPAGAPRLPAPTVRITLSVSESFRGNPGNMAVVQTDTSDCAYPFEVGHAYLVFAEAFQGTLRVNKCSATRPAKMSVTTIQQLRAQRDGTALPDLYGFASTHALDSSEFGWEQVQPVPGLTVTAEFNGREHQTQTADDGSYAFRGMPAGHYHVSIGAPPGRVALPAQGGITAGPGTCPMHFEIFYDGHISGTVIGPDGQTVTGSVTAQYAGPEKINGAPVGSTIKNGAFDIPRLAPGQYRLVFSPGGGGFVYYPGTRTAHEATLVEVGENSHIDGLQFRVF